MVGKALISYIDMPLWLSGSGKKGLSSREPSSSLMLLWSELSKAPSVSSGDIQEGSGTSCSSTQWNYEEEFEDCQSSSSISISDCSKELSYYWHSECSLRLSYLKLRSWMG